MNKFDFFKTTMPISRIADYYLGCLDSSVFIDLNLNNKGQIYLQRISFDGYGCCEIENSMTLDKRDSIIFVDEMGKELIDQITIEKLVKSLIKLNADKIWTDALEEYELLDK
jgi:hypothetical protein